MASWLPLERVQSYLSGTQRRGSVPPWYPLGSPLAPSVRHPGAHGLHPPTRRGLSRHCAPWSLLRLGHCALVKRGHCAVVTAAPWSSEVTAAPWSLRRGHCALVTAPLSLRLGHCSVVTAAPCFRLLPPWYTSLRLWSLGLAWSLGLPLRGSITLWYTRRMQITRSFHSRPMGVPAVPRRAPTHCPRLRVGTRFAVGAGGDQVCSGCGWTARPLALCWPWTRGGTRKETFAHGLTLFDHCVSTDECVWHPRRRHPLQSLSLTWSPGFLPLFLSLLGLCQSLCCISSTRLGLSIQWLCSGTRVM